MHGGQKGEVLKAKGEAITAWSAAGGTPTVNASEVVLRVLEMTWFRANLLAGLLQQQFEAEQAARGEAMVVAAEEDGTPEGAVARRGDVGPGAGLIGHTRSAAPGVGVYVTGEALRGLAQMEERERQNAVKFAKTAHDMGIAEEHLRLVETHTAELAGLIGRILDGLDLTPAQRQLVAVVVPRELTRGTEPGRTLP